MADPRPDLPPLPELAEALCVTSHHGLTRTAWPCPYHAERAARVVEELRSMRCRALSTRDAGEGER